MSEEALHEATEIKFTAERLLGEMLKHTERRGTQHSRRGGSKGSTREPLPSAPPTLTNLGITKKLSSEAQMLADLPAKTFNEVREGKKTLTQVKTERRRKQRVGRIQQTACAPSAPPRRPVVILDRFLPLPKLTFPAKHKHWP